MGESSSRPSRREPWRSPRPPRRRTPDGPSGRSPRAHCGETSVETFTVAGVAAWRDELHATGVGAELVALRVSTVRRLVAAVGADPLVAHVRCTQIQHERPPALSDRELSALLPRPDLRTTIGVRDRGDP